VVTFQQEVLADIQEFFTNPNHWIYRSKGSPSLINPDSVYHITQLEVLFEDRHFHKLTYRALQELRRREFLRSTEVATEADNFILVSRSGVRYVKRKEKAHLELAREYSSQVISKATGDYAETLALSGLRELHLTLVDRNARNYQGKTWTESDHDLDFIMEKEGIGYGIEVKNTLDYMPPTEFATKLKMCRYLGLRPLFIVRIRDKLQWDQTKKAGGLIYMFKTKVFPPGQDALIRRIWEQMRLPVTIWNDWPPAFHSTIGAFLHTPDNYSLWGSPTIVSVEHLLM